MLITIFWLIIFTLSLLILVTASDYFIDSAEKIGKYIGLSAFVVGLLIVSIGTSLPELISSIISVTKGASQIVISNVVGSNIANIFLVFGIVAIVGKDLKINYDLLSIDLPLFVGSSFLIAIMVYNLKFTIFETILSLLFLIVYLIYTVSNRTIAKDKEIKKEVNDILNIKRRNRDLLNTFVIFFLTIILIYFSANLLIDSILKLSNILKIGSELIAVSIVAIGTSLPELIVSLKAVAKGKIEIAVGNILGSTIFNCVGVMGIASLFGKLIIPEIIIKFALPMMLIGTILYFFIVQDKKITYVEGWILLLFYFLFIGFLLNLI